MKSQLTEIDTDSKPIVLLSGDYPDPSIVRVGQDYYMTHSSFDYTPGLLIWHSRNLRDWEPIGHAIHRHVGSILAPEFIYHNGTYYIYFPAAGTNWVVTAQSPEGPWSDPIDLRVGLIDPGHLADEEGNRYLFLSGGHMIRLTSDGLSTEGELLHVYDGWRYPREWRTEGFYLESPKLIRQNGYYYMVSAEGGTGGPATSHMIVAARAVSPLGPWENCPFNPVLRTTNRGARWRSKGHGTLIDTPEGDWYVVYHAYEDQYLTLGRQTLMEPVIWDDSGWFRIADRGADDDAFSHFSGVTRSDDFHSPSLSPQWHFFGGKRINDYTLSGGELLLDGLPTERKEPLLCIPYHHAYETLVRMRVEGDVKGRLSLFYKPGFQCGIAFNGKQVFACRNNYEAEFTQVPANTVTLRLVNDNHEIDLYYRHGDSDWTKLDHGFEMSGFHANVLGDFLSLRIALDAIGEGRVAFSDFVYKALQ